jgi:flagellar biosynthesis protein FlhB
MMNSRAVSGALGRATLSQLHPKMLALLLGPFLLSLVLWAAAAWFFWQPLTNLIGSVLFSNGFMAQVNHWLAQIGLPAKGLVSAVLALLLVVPLMFVTAVAAIAVFAMPAVTRHLTVTDYPDVVKKGNLALGASIWNSVSSLIIFVIGYIITLPLWLIPPLFIVVPLLWWGWFNARVMRFDSLLEHASEQERSHIISHNKSDFRLLGLATAALNYLPPLFIVAPVFGALAFSHYSFDQLRQLRQINKTGEKTI